MKARKPDRPLHDLLGGASLCFLVFDNMIV